MGEQELATEMDFSRVGRVNAMLARRLELLAEVKPLPHSITGPILFTCWLHHLFLCITARTTCFWSVCEPDKDKLLSFVQTQVLASPV